MKKTILAIAITGLFAATAAQAATVYEADGVTIDLYGDVEVQYLNDTAKDSDKDGVILIDDADFGFGLTYDVGNGYTVGGTMEISAEDGTAELGDTFVGVSHDSYGTLTIGNQATIFDDAGISGDYEFGFDTYVGDVTDASTQVIKYKGEWDNVYAGVAYVLSADKLKDSSHTVDANVGIRVGGLDATVFYSTGKTAAKDEVTAYILQGVYTFDAFDLGAFYANTATKDNASNVDTKDNDAYGVSGNYYMDAWNFGLGLGIVKNNVADTDSKNYYANVGYSFTSSVHVYAELGKSDADNTELGYITGVKINF
ncbi:porin-like protein H [Psychromonas sp. CNPT3]|uniref:porin n=1 Tax=Psychromonas sp. CNPT3 TaxID=314282 RepID=UPI00006E9903|nr:porin [Psychromonas sp. CNPT3]AGH82291.1 porin-like protein H [Psychromonas sp. CNPT3]